MKNFKNHRGAPAAKNSHKGSHRPSRPSGGGRSGSPSSGNQSASGINKSWRQVAGTHAIRELIKVRPQTIKSLVVQKNWASSSDLRDLIDEVRGLKIHLNEVSESDLQKMCPSHQGAVAFSDFNPHFDFLEAGWEANSMVVALDGVEDPHNLGAVLRTSWLMGVQGLILPEDRAVGLTATVHKVACGGVEHVPLAKTNNFADPFKTLKEAGFWVFGMSHKAKKTIYDLKVPEKVIWVMGAEDKGLRIPTERACDELICIPQLAADASYNVSVATAIALSETRRQWGVHKGK